MAWHAFIRSWNAERKMYVSLTLRIEDAQGPGCLLRLYDEERAVAEALAESPQRAMAEALQMARTYLKDTSITEESLRWMQS